MRARHPGSQVPGTHDPLFVRMWVQVTTAFLLMFPYCETSKNRPYANNTNTLRSDLTVSTMHVHGHNYGLLMS